MDIINYLLPKSKSLKLGNQKQLHKYVSGVYLFLNCYIFKFSLSLSTFVIDNM